ncbi:MAG TPA: protein translocase subunit SecF [Pusillimonas sp.]|jgi:preprotein translocase subunit SecF|nr:protein translocase subunit SecF [Pusillimonas sp.]MBC43800.1 protein translocase subunit SecF [Pusillimonas sp.]HBT31690.1 protein translocase subunit SecF [Pusillimonas sp.]HCP78666.1 protein translocase subunit SecF [Pusillimonas sp.]|tara:strand:+ start:42208 stop:43143 length:936 start_codon:yes stop_codon:yes gene_type:complete
MELFRIKRTIPFMRHALVLNLISLITFALAVFFIATKGFHLSIEFTGGTVMETHYEQSADLEQVRNTLSDIGYSDFQVQNFGTSRDVMIRLPVRDGEDATVQSEKVLAALQADTPNVELRRVEFVGPQVGEELVTNGLLALLCVVIGIMVYLALRFEWKFAIAGVVANFHDVIIILGFFAFFQWEFSLAVLAGVLAVLGYSVNESVVIMDRIRENFRKQRRATTTEVIDGAITQTISRTIITHTSTQIMVLSMLIFGGPTLHYFALALTIGIWFGIYSSVFVAAAIAMWLGIKREDLVKPVKKEETEVEEG